MLNVTKVIYKVNGKLFCAYHKLALVLTHVDCPDKTDHNILLININEHANNSFLRR